MQPKIYLDYNATAPLRPEARQALLGAHDAPLNASAVHSFGRRGRKIVEDARSTLSNAITCPAAQIIFNSGATEGNNTVLQHFALTYPNERILVGATEHPSVIEATQQNTPIPVLPSGLIDLAALEKMLQQKPKTSLVSVMLANNETGIIQPIAEISALAHRYGALMHSDATQALGRIPLNMQELGIDFMTCSAHKIGGAQGVGALAIGLCGITPILLHGGGQEKKARAGTENVAGIASFGAALSAALSSLTEESKRLINLQSTLENQVKSITPAAIIHGITHDRLPNTTFLSLPGLTSETMLMAFDLEGIAVSNGSACSSGTVKQSHVLRAMGVDQTIAQSALRISTGWNTSQEDIDRFLEVWNKVTCP